MVATQVILVVVAVVVLLLFGIIIGMKLLPFVNQVSVKKDALLRVSSQATAHAETIRYLSPATEYRVTVSGSFTFEGELKDQWDHPASRIEVIPAIAFRGETRKALIDGRRTFVITKSAPSVSGTFAVPSLITEYRDMARIPDPYSGRMNVLSTFVVKEGGDTGNFVVRLDRVAIPQSLFQQPPCKAYFTVRCSDERILQLRACAANEDKPYECDRELSMCKGRVRLRVNAIECGKGADVLISSEAGDFADKDVGDDVTVAFWRTSHCTETEGNLNECARDFLGSTRLIIPLG